MNTRSPSSRHAKASTFVAVAPLPFTLQLLAVAILFASAGGAYALPVGGAVSAGSATIGSGGGTTTITQASQNAAINWQSFNIGTGETVNFVQPNASATALNRVLGADPSSILGSLNANGKVFLVNPNGIVFGQGASVNVGGLVGSTRGISDSDFMAGHYNFEGDGAGSVVNHGSINAKGGSVALLGANVSNQGVIQAQMGSVALAAGNAFTLDVAGDGLLNVAVNKGAVDALVQNGGLIQADGGRVLMTAQSANSLLPSSVNNTGVVRAQTLENHNGTIMLMGDMQSGTVNVAGTLDASAPNGGNGGFIETSAAHVKVASGTGAQVTTLAPSGKTGTWLIDPKDYVISTAVGADMSGIDLSTRLTTTNVEISSAQGKAAGDGDIWVRDAVTWTAATTLTLSAERDINVEQPITTTKGNLKLLAVRDVNQDATITATKDGGIGGDVTMVAGNNINLNQVLTVTNGNAFLVAGNDGLKKRTVNFGAKAVVTGPASTVTIYYAPDTYASPTDFTGNFTLTGGATLTPFMWANLQANDKVYNGNNAATLSLRDNPPGVSAQPGTATFDTADVGNVKPVAYSGYSLAGTDSGKYALFVPFSYTDGTAGIPGSGMTSANITPVLLTIKANDATKIEGNTLVIPNSAFTATGLVNNETVGGATLTSPGTVASATAAGSPYVITASNATAGTFKASNYIITYAPGRLAITAPPVVTPPVTTPPVTTPPVTTPPVTTPPVTTPPVTTPPVTTEPEPTSPGTTPGTTVPGTTPGTTPPVTTVPGATPPVTTVPGGTAPISAPPGSTPTDPNATGARFRRTAIPGLPLASTPEGVPVDEYLGAKTPDIGNSGNPGNPNGPVNPGNPANPNDPGSPGSPNNPGNPGNPNDPGNPANPNDPGNPPENNASHNGRTPYIPPLAALTVVGGGVNVPGNQLTQVMPIRPVPVKDALGDPAEASKHQIPYPYKAPVYLPRQERN